MQRVLPQSNSPLLTQAGSNQTASCFKNCTIYNVGGLALSILGILGLFFGYYTLGSALCFLSFGCILFGESSNEVPTARVSRNQNSLRSSSNQRSRQVSMSRRSSRVASELPFKEIALQRVDKLCSVPIKPLSSSSIKAIKEVAGRQRLATLLALTSRPQVTKRTEAVITPFPLDPNISDRVASMHRGAETRIVDQLRTSSQEHSERFEEAYQRSTESHERERQELAVRKAKIEALMARFLQIAPDIERIKRSFQNGEANLSSVREGIGILTQIIAEFPPDFHDQHVYKALVECKNIEKKINGRK